MVETFEKICLETTPILHYSLILVHDIISKVVLFSDERVSRLSQKVLYSSNKSENLHFLLQLSVTEGVKDMYAQFLNRTRKKVNTSVFIAVLHLFNGVELWKNLEY